MSNVLLSLLAPIEKLLVFNKLNNCWTIKQEMVFVLKGLKLINTDEVGELSQPSPSQLFVQIIIDRVCDAIKKEEKSDNKKV